MDWEKVAFKDISGEMCKLQWLETFYNLRKCCTLKELVLEVKEDVKNPHKSKTHTHTQTHTHTHTHTHTEETFWVTQEAPDNLLPFFKGDVSLVLPKTPQTVYQEKDKEFPENMKLKHIQDFQKEKQEFEEKIAQFGEHHSELV